MILYTTDICPMCIIAKDRLDAAGIEYTICQDESEMSALGIDRLPCANIDGVLYTYKQILDMCKEGMNK